MKVTEPNTGNNNITGTYIRVYVAFLIMSFVIGCAAGGKRMEDIKPSVTKPENGADGFVIKEVSTMDDVSREDFNTAVVMVNDKNYDRAIELLQKVIDKSPGVTAPYINIAIAFQGTGKPEQAEEYLKTALSLFPDHPVVCNEYGLLYRKTGRFAEAKSMYEKGLVRFPDYYPLHRNLGILCDLYLNDPACALNHYEIYSRANPEDKQVKLWIAGLRLAMEGK